MVASDEQLDFFSLSWVQDMLHPNWEMLCDEQGNYLLNVPIDKKMGFSYRLQPFFIRAFSIPKNTEEKWEEVISYLKKSASYLQLNISLHDPALTDATGIYQQLDLTKGMQELRASYSTNTKRILKKLPSDFSFCEITDVSAFISFFKEQKGEELSGFTKAVWDRLTNLLLEAQKRGMLKIQTVQSNGEFMAAAVFISFKGTYFFLKGTATANGKKAGAMYALLDHEIEESSVSHHTFDFVGSNNPAIAQFYRKFGATDKSYGVIKQNNLPWLLRLIKP